MTRKRPICFRVEFDDGSTAIETIDPDVLRGGSDWTARFIIQDRISKEAREEGSTSQRIKHVQRTACPQ
ncbi:hypothetical protein [Magnetospirillum sp. 64-120]|uniref:hypothetical protein n=1 Tax=Magnetospirillum sp. 64-120 TaxID=1895778 RepID=UPI0009294C42|nr:hypothetical protein [Magnetospirillum sp. 64-120]OJX65820.1 MAG: hypothetical protein BGO92_06915 [Magnetospirillum sp. 64-120]